MQVDDCLAQHQIIVRAGYTVVQPTSGASSRIESAVEQNNQAARLEGLEDDLNPEVLDPDKVEAFLLGLPGLPDETLGKLRDRVLYLNAPTLFLGTATAITAHTLGQGYSLAVPESAPGGLVQPTMSAEIDKALAQDLTGRAREATALFDQQVKELESRVAGLGQDSEELGSVLRELSLARSKRFAASMVWRDNSAALAQADPDNRELAAEAKRAREAAAEYVSPPWIGMPAPG